MDKRLQKIKSSVAELREDIFGKENGMDVYSECSMGFETHEFRFNRTNLSILTLLDLFGLV